MSCPARALLSSAVSLVLVSVPGAAVGATPGAAQLPAGFELEEVLSGLDCPTSLTFLPDGRVLVLEQGGDVLVADPGEAPLPATPTVYLSIPDVDTVGERGLLDISLDPDFARNGYLYVFYSHDLTERHRVSRFTATGAVADPASEVVLWQSSEPWSHCCHIGGALDFGPDGRLYIATGDGFSVHRPQDLSRSGGKLLRIEKDGSIPPDNPFLGVPGALPEVWALGLRNPFRARFDLPTGRFFVAEVGSNDHQNAYEDIVLGAAGANYGWPDCEGPCADPAYTDPVHTYPHAGAKACVIGGFVYRGTGFPAAWRGRYFYADFARGWIRALDFVGPSVVADNAFGADLGAVAALEAGPGGALYFLVHDQDGPLLGALRRIVHPGPGTAGDAERAADQGSGGAPSLDPGAPPVPSIATPPDGASFRFDSRIVAEADAQDPDGPLPDSAFAWRVVLRTGAGAHAVLGPLVGRQVSFAVAELEADEPLREAELELELTVTDGNGLSGLRSVRLRPELTSVSIAAAPSGVPVSAGGMTPRATPFRLRALVGEPLPLVAPSVFCAAGRGLSFSSWSSGGPASTSWQVPAAGGELLATWSANGDDCGCNRALAFDGVGDLAHFTPLVLTGDFTLEAWARPGESDAFDGLIGPRGAPYDAGLHLEQGVPKWRPSAGSDVLELAAAAPLPSAEWTHLALVRAGATVTLHVDGAAEADGIWTEAVRIGVVGAGLGGELDGVRVWERALDGPALVAVREWDRPADAAGILAAWNFDDSPGSPVAFDSSGASGDGSGGGRVLWLRGGAGSSSGGPERIPAGAPIRDRPACGVPHVPSASRGDARGSGPKPGGR